MLDDDKLLTSYKERWLTSKAAQELDYPIFFAVSEKGGKDNRGEPDYKKDMNGELELDEHGHLIVNHDLGEIADSFVVFVREQELSFWGNEE